MAENELDSNSLQPWQLGISGACGLEHDIKLLVVLARELHSRALRAYCLTQHLLLGFKGATSCGKQLHC
jgi:hypothetical protein